MANIVQGIEQGSVQIENDGLDAGGATGWIFFIWAHAQGLTFSFCPG